MLKKSLSRKNILILISIVVIVVASCTFCDAVNSTGGGFSSFHLNFYEEKERNAIVAYGALLSAFFSSLAILSVFYTLANEKEIRKKDDKRKKKEIKKNDLDTLELLYNLLVVSIDGMLDQGKNINKFCNDKDKDNDLLQLQFFTHATLKMLNDKISEPIYFKIFQKYYSQDENWNLDYANLIDSVSVCLESVIILKNKHDEYTVNRTKKINKLLLTTHVIKDSAELNNFLNLNIRREFSNYRKNLSEKQISHFSDESNHIKTLKKIKEKILIEKEQIKPKTISVLEA